MEASRLRLFRPLTRVVLYGSVIAAILLIRGPARERNVFPPFSAESDTTRTITLMGLDLAPVLIPSLVAAYRRDFSELEVLVTEGGTAHGLEALVNKKISVAMLYRPPTPSEQALFRSVLGDTVIWFPVALGGIAILGHGGQGVAGITLDELRGILGDQVAPRFDRLYASDPNQGLWDAFCGRLGFPEGQKPERVTFLEHEDAVIQAVAADPRGLGLASTLGLPKKLEGRGVHALPVRSDTISAYALPTYDAIGYGEYPLFHYLYVSCLPYDSVRGGMFVTYLTSNRGQRQVERAGFLPARLALREIHLTRSPVAQSG